MAQHINAIQTILARARTYAGVLKDRIPEKAEDLKYDGLMALKLVATKEIEDTSGMIALQRGHYEELVEWALENKKITEEQSLNGLALSEKLIKPIAKEATSVTPAEVKIAIPAEPAITPPATTTSAEPKATETSVTQPAELPKAPSVADLEASELREFERKVIRSKATSTIPVHKKSGREKIAEAITGFFKKKQKIPLEVAAAETAHQQAKAALNEHYLSDEALTALDSLFGFKPNRIAILKEHHPELLAGFSEALLDTSKQHYIGTHTLSIMSDAAGKDVNAHAIEAARNSLKYLPTHKDLLQKTADIQLNIAEKDKALQAVKETVAKSKIKTPKVKAAVVEAEAAGEVILPKRYKLDFLRTTHEIGTHRATREGEYYIKPEVIEAEGESWIKKHPGKAAAIVAGGLALGGWAAHAMNSKETSKSQGK